MDFTPEQQAAINAEVAKQVSAMQIAQQNSLDMTERQHANSMAMQQSQQTAQLALQESQQAAQAALQTAQAASQAEIQAAQAAASLALHAKQAKLSAVQIAQTTLLANRSNQPVDAREVLASDIIAYAESLVAYVNG